MSCQIEELSSLCKEELVQRLLELQKENRDMQKEMDELRQQLQQKEQQLTLLNRRVDVNNSSPHHRQSYELNHGQPSGTETGTEHGHYTVSFSVMVIENGTAISVPLSSVIDKSYMRPDLREADTPVVASSFLRDDSESLARHSIGSLFVDRSPSMSTEESIGTHGDMRGLSIASAAAIAASGGGRPSMSLDITAGDDANEPVPQDPNATNSQLTSLQQQQQQQQQQQSYGRQRNSRHELRQLSLGRLLNRRAMSLDPDALVSHRTLQAFHQQMLDNGSSLSPVSSYGNAIYHYIVKNFAVRNGCRHSPSDIEGFGRTLCSLCTEVKSILQSEPRHGSMVSPCYVFGDLHGNFWDLFYFLDNLISFQDLRYTPHRFLFLGDYVDRGEFSVEVVAYLFAMKVLAPDKVLLLRGNHEDTLVSGDISSYGSTSFRAQCRNLFGHSLGEELWHRASETFAYLPLTANIDGRIFCTHGGIPRYRGGVDDRLQILSRDDFPVFESFFQASEEETAQQRMCRQMAMDTCWADPADDESVLDKWGFGANPRGSGIILFGSVAVDDFLAHYNYDYIFRAHQEKSDGLKLSKSARVFTIFSTSAYVGHENGAGLVLVADGKIRLIIKNADECNEAPPAADEEEDVDDVDGGKC
ncbi:serine/threonine protein phosphatase [Trypanosoma theileri]|uniref:Serine/threonine-protein phosphatase n=1 Tax=Trypanosoma theileri TaxID=67003 RepID=A0A1X0NPA5_9TRYP|nr:serine/threonine protein phosphatase [Trypanosoma theileri]ORC86009.1 serine/threonine protein phosphatase [Trypanosoma theileri]